MEKFNIAIDGPAGAGKSSIARLAAKEMGFLYVDTGAMYRAIAVYMLENGIDTADQASVATAAAAASVDIKYLDGEQHVFLNGQDVTAKLRTEEAGNAASLVSAVPQVREHLLALQKKLAAENNVIMDGRDIGTAILPDAQLKIFLTASSLVRAKRRQLQLKEKGLDADLEEIKKDIEQRDLQDMTRAASPLRQAEDAIYLDTSDMNMDDVLEYIIGAAKKAGWR